MLYSLAVVAGLCASTHAYGVQPMARHTAVVPASSQRAASGPTMILDQMAKAADAAKGAAAEAVVAKKVADKLAKAKEKVRAARGAFFCTRCFFSHTAEFGVCLQYPIPEKYEPVMQGFFTSYMTEVYKAGNDVDYYEKVLTNLFKKVLENMKEPHQFEPFHAAMREPFDYYALGARTA